MDRMMAPSNGQVKVIPYDSQAYWETVDLRTRILREPLGMNLSPEALAKEADSIHLALYQDASLLACLVLKPLPNKAIKMRQMAVEENQQGKGLGRQLVIAAEAECSNRGYHHIMLHARHYATGFYEKLGYQVVGEPFDEIGIKHFKMVKEI